MQGIQERREAGDHHGRAGKRLLTEILHHQKKIIFQPFFQFLILFCLTLLLCYTLFSSNLSWNNFHYQRLFNLDNKTNVLPPFRIHPKHKLQPNKIHTPEELPAEQPDGAWQYRYHQAYPKNYQFVMDNADICKHKTPFLVLMVPVSPDDVEARDAIRQTWGNNSLVQRKVVVTLFVLGLSDRADAEKLRQENLQHKDLIQSDFIDTYSNLTIKTMVLMNWLTTHCSDAAYAMKVDSDMFLNIDNLVIMLLKPGIPKVNYLTGMLMWNRPVVRTKSSKWYVPEELYPESTYPTYTLGMGYVFSNDLPKKYVEISKSIKPFNIEDAYIGMCMKTLGLEPTSPPVPSQFQAYSSRYDRCKFSKVITYILSSSKQLVEFWTDLKKSEAPCSPGQTSRQVYTIFLFATFSFILVVSCVICISLSCR